MATPIRNIRLGTEWTDAQELADLISGRVGVKVGVTDLIRVGLVRLMADPDLVQILRDALAVEPAAAPTQPQPEQGPPRSPAA